MSDVDSENDEVADLSSPDVTTKYQTCAQITNKALQAVIAGCVEGAEIVTLCELGDSIMLEETGKLYNKKKGGGEEKDKDKPAKKMEKGVAFPTCISVNETVGHFSPLKGESKQLKAGDLVKIDLASHIDGFIAAAAHTVLVGEATVDDKRADVTHAAWTAAEAALRLVQVGAKSSEITKAFSTSSKEFSCNPIQGVKSHNLKRHVIDGARAIPSTENLEEKLEPFEFELNEVYCIDVVMSTGEGVGRQAEVRSTVFKRAVENNYILKTQKARQFISEVNRRFPALPFSLRAIEDEQVARVGVSEAKRHELLEEYPVLKEKDGCFVAQFKFTVLLLPGGTKKITGVPFTQEKQFATSCEVKDEELKKLLASSANPKKKNKKAKKEKEAEAGKDA